MDFTQRLECTQNTFETNEKVLPEQVGYVGIIGSKFPIVKGPNRVGRDPEKCNILLNLNSISRQHAVINILNDKNIMLMDLDSANKTRVSDKILQPFIPHPLKHGDIVHFGDIFGMLWLFNEENDLPMTQLIPETPEPKRCLDKINSPTTIPESPDVSDRDETSIAPSQPRERLHVKVSNKLSFKPSIGTVPIKPFGKNRKDNAYCYSKTNSFNISLNHSRNTLQTTDGHLKENKNNDIHELETQIPYPNKMCSSIHSVETQIPDEDKPSESIYYAQTQMPRECLQTTSKYLKNSNLCMNKANYQTDVHETETQDYLPHDTQTQHKTKLVKKKLYTSCSSKETNLKDNTTDDEMLFNIIDELPAVDVLESPCTPKNHDQFQDISPNSSKYVVNAPFSVSHQNATKIPLSHSSKDCEDLNMALTQKVTEKQNINDSGDGTYCEDILDENILMTSKIENQQNNLKRDVTAEKILSKIIKDKSHKESDVCFEEMLTQVIPEEKKNVTMTKCNFEDLSTQVLNEASSNNIEQMQEFSEEIVSPFKIPAHTVSTNKTIFPTNLFSEFELPTELDVIEQNDDYYKSTQDVFEDLCSQRLESLNEISNNNIVFKKPPNIEAVEYPFSKNSKIAATVSNNEGKTKSKNLKTNVKTGKFTKKNENNPGAENYVMSLPNTEVMDGLGTNSDDKSKQFSSVSSVENTPKKIMANKLMHIDLPNSQEIRDSVHTVTKRSFAVLNSDSESENNSEEPYLPNYHIKKKFKSYPKLGHSSDLDLEKRTSRPMKRVRKPTSKIIENNEKSKKNNSSRITSQSLKSKDDSIDSDIITENISRLQFDYVKGKNSRSHDLHKKYDEYKSKNSYKEQNKKQSKESNTQPQASSSKKIKSSDANDANKNKKGQNLDVKNELKKVSRTEKSFKTKHIAISEMQSVNPDENKIKLDSQRHSNTTKDTLEPSTSNTNTSARSSRNRTKIYKCNPLHPEDSSTKNNTGNQDKNNIRRSNRQHAKVKQSKYEKHVTKSILTHTKTDKGSIWTWKSESGSDSSTSVDKSSKDNDWTPSKKIKTSNSSCTSSRSTSTTLDDIPQVLFASFPFRGRIDKNRYEQIVTLGAVIVNDVTKCSVFVAKNIKRTTKLLCAVGLGRPIVGPSWIDACFKANRFVDPWQHILKDKQAEKKFNFDLENTLRGKRNFLKGYIVSCTPRTIPRATELKRIVECSGGVWKEGGTNWVCVSTIEDDDLWPALKAKGATIVTPEFILLGVLKQKLNIQAYVYDRYSIHIEQIDESFSNR